MGRHTTALLVVAGALLAPARPALAATGPWQENEQSRVRLVSPYERAPRQGALRLGLEFHLVPGWHVYWKNSGDAGYPPAIDFAPTPAVAEARLRWPAPSRFDLPGGLVAFGYASQVIYPIDARLNDPGGDRLTFAADLDYLVCEIDCVPYSYRLSLEQRLALAGAESVLDPQDDRLLGTWERAVPAKLADVAGLTARSRLDLSRPDAPSLEVRIDGAGAAAGSDLFFETHPLFTLGRPRRETTPSGLRFTVPLAFREVPQSLPEKTEVAWTATGLAWPGGGGAVEARQVAEAGPPPASPTAGPRLGDLGAALLAGLLFLLSPAGLAGLAAELPRLRRRLSTSPRAVRERAGLLATGVVAGSLVLAAAARVAAGRGLAVGWGAEPQPPAGLALLAVVAVALALHLWGLLGARQEGGGWDRGIGLLLGGAVALLALPWSLPPLTGAAARAASASWGWALGTALAFAAGLALPYLLAAAAPALLARLPDRWSRGGRLAEAAGFLVVGEALWILHDLTGKLPPATLAGVELGLLAVALLAWARRAAAGRRGLAAVFLAAMLIAAAATVRLAAP